MSTSPENDASPPPPLDPGLIVFTEDGKSAIIVEAIVYKTQKMADHRDKPAGWKYKVHWTSPSFVTRFGIPYLHDFEFRLATVQEEEDIFKGQTGRPVYPGAIVRVVGSRNSLKRTRKWAECRIGRVLYCRDDPHLNMARWEVAVRDPSSRIGYRSTMLFESQMEVFSPLEALALEA